MPTLPTVDSWCRLLLTGTASLVHVLPRVHGTITCLSWTARKSFCSMSLPFLSLGRPNHTSQHFDLRLGLGVRLRHLAFVVTTDTLALFPLCWYSSERAHHLLQYLTRFFLHILYRIAREMDHDTHGMDMGQGSSSSSAHAGMMIPWLHFTSGDNLFFETWKPSSPGAIVGACIGLFILSIIDRWLAAVRRLMGSYWRRRAMLALDRSSQPLLPGERKVDALASVEAVTTTSGPHSPTSPTRYSRTRRTVAPFIARHDIPRGVLYAVQSFFMYALMLAVMTFHAGYIISIIAGLAIGEVLFGRLGDVHDSH